MHEITILLNKVLIVMFDYVPPSIGQLHFSVLKKIGLNAKNNASFNMHKAFYGPATYF